jgi:hypothetical protein
MMALMIVAEQYGLNPFLKEIYAYPDKNNGIVPVVGVDGWSNIVNAHPQYDGFEVVYSDSKVEVTGVNFPVHEWIEVVIHRKDRTVPSVSVNSWMSAIALQLKGMGRTVPIKSMAHGKRTLDGCCAIRLSFSAGVWHLALLESLTRMRQNASSMLIRMWLEPPSRW